MFDKLKSALGSLTQIATHTTLSKEDIDSFLWDFEVSLIESDVASEAIESINANLRQKLVGLKIPRSEDKEKFVLNELKSAIRETFSKTKKLDVIQLAKEKAAKNRKDHVGPFIVMFLGINGTGKTTTVAKFANLLQKNHLSVVAACGDTHRAGAIEQLTEHANRLKIKAIAQSYGSDPAAVAKDAQLYAIAHGTDAVIIDTAGRIQTSRNLMEEMSKIVRVVQPDVKIFVGDSLAGNDAISQAKEFLKYTDFDAAILTKADADVKGGGALSIAFITQRPIIFLGVGQEYDDLMPFDLGEFIDSLFTK
ncbi:MAG: signal recognition particle-docking protein FtsY [Nitrososphaerota archaeon]|nr:signal recognition particle-docking protein FtsY [Nitrososphaerota archaeon]